MKPRTLTPFVIGGQLSNGLYRTSVPHNPIERIRLILARVCFRAGRKLLLNNETMEIKTITESLDSRPTSLPKARKDG